MTRSQPRNVIVGQSQPEPPWRLGLARSAGPPAYRLRRDESTGDHWPWAGIIASNAGVPASE